MPIDPTKRQKHRPRTRAHGRTERRAQEVTHPHAGIHSTAKAISTTDSPTDSGQIPSSTRQNEVEGHPENDHPTVNQPVSDRATSHHGGKGWREAGKGMGEERWGRKENGKTRTSKPAIALSVLSWAPQSDCMYPRKPISPLSSWFSVRSFSHAYVSLIRSAPHQRISTRPQKTKRIFPAFPRFLGPHFRSGSTLQTSVVPFFFFFLLLFSLLRCRLYTVHLPFR